MKSLRHFPFRPCLVGLMLAIPSVLAAEDLLDPESHPKFVHELAQPYRVDATDGARYRVSMMEVEQWLGLVDESGDPLLTTVWGYGHFPDRGLVPVTYPGPTFVAHRDVPVEITWVNALPMYNYGEGFAAHLLPVDTSIHIADPARGGIPTVTHLHGGHTESASDGLPEAWFTQRFREVGPHFVKRDYHYDNDQEAATLWYHDHALGITRLNVYAGLAGFYLLRDDNELGLIGSGVLPGGPYEREVVIQDRMFTDDGELYYPSSDPDIEPGFEPLPSGPSVLPEFFGDFIVTNGLVWPDLSAEPRKYRLRMLNGSDSRFYVLEFHDASSGGTPQEFLQIGTDVGFLDSAVPITRLLLGPGERADLVVDFQDHDELYLLNFGPDEPFRGFNPDGTLSDGHGGVLPPADPATTGRILKVSVDLPLDPQVPDATVMADTPLRAPIPALEPTGDTRQLVLFEGLDQYGRLQPLLGTLEEGSLAWFQPITENPMLDDVELWEIYNATEDAHPIHLHLVAFQILDRESFEGFVEPKPQPEHGGGTGVGGILHVTGLGGDARPPDANEDGWKDTAVMLPGEVTRVIARFDREGRYVWHCHILSHEDHEMMRPYYVGPMSPARPIALADPVPGSAVLRAVQSRIGSDPSVRFRLATDATVELKVFDPAGRQVHALGGRPLKSGVHEIRWDGSRSGAGALPSGIYLYRLTAGGEVRAGKLLLTR